MYTVILCISLHMDLNTGIRSSRACIQCKWPPHAHNFNLKGSTLKSFLHLLQHSLAGRRGRSDRSGLRQQAHIIGVDVGEQAPAWQHYGLTWRHAGTGQAIGVLQQQMPMSGLDDPLLSSD